jgi:CHAD domain-containing protein
MAKAKEIAGLDCEGEAFFNIELILSTRLEEMCALKAKALEWAEIEGVHDMRVASRRLRSALRDFAPYFNERKSPRKQLREIARSLGAVRDEDVAIVALKKLRKQTKEEEVADGIKHIIAERRRRQALARKKLTLAISDEAIGQLQEEFTAWLQSAAAGRAKNSKENSPASLTFRMMGREVVLSQYKELDKLGASLFNPFDVEPLHEMRIAAKRLRYSLELFLPCFGEGLAGFAKELAELQTSLGDLHDCDVWIDDLGVRLAARDGDVIDHESDKAANQQTTEHAAALWLLQHFVKERTRHYGDALSRWSQWKAEGFYSKLNENLQETSSPPSQTPDNILTHKHE